MQMWVHIYPVVFRGIFILYRNQYIRTHKPIVRWVLVAARHNRRANYATKTFHIRSVLSKSQCVWSGLVCHLLAGCIYNKFHAVSNGFLWKNKSNQRKYQIEFKYDLNADALILFGIIRYNCYWFFLFWLAKYGNRSSGIFDWSNWLANEWYRFRTW